MIPRRAHRAVSTALSRQAAVALIGRAAWAVEVKLGLAPGIGHGFRSACEDVAPERAFIVYSGDGRYPLSNDVEVIGLREMAGLLKGK